MGSTAKMDAESVRVADRVENLLVHAGHLSLGCERAGCGESADRGVEDLDGVGQRDGGRRADGRTRRPA